jgi:rhamnogalacturonyl hydrolase YesR
MKMSMTRSAVFTAVFLAVSFQLFAQKPAPDIITPTPRVPQNPAQPNHHPEGFGGALIMPLSREINPGAVLKAMERVADWQLANPVTLRPTGWICSVGDVGMMTLAGISGDPKYRDAMFDKGETNGWILPQYQGRKYHADDQCYGQVCAELYFLYRENRMIVPMREHFDWILANPPPVRGLDNRLGQDQWSWCDALFMAPPTWTRLYAATGDERYLDFAVTNWWRTTDYLYSTNDHLFFRDSTFFNQAGTNGAKIFWSRGNGWVFAATVRMLQYLPMNHPDRPRFEQLFKDMAGKILSLQQPDGLWRASLLDPEDYPMPEASGSAMFTYGLAWGVNQGLLDRTTFEPAVRKAWPALVGCVDADGKLTHIQPAGSQPVRFAEDSTQPYGGGVFLLAGSEVYRMAVLEEKVLKGGTESMHMVDNSPPDSGHHTTWQPLLKVKVTNPTEFRRDCETAVINLRTAGIYKEDWSGSPIEVDISKLLRTHKFVIMDGLSSRILDSQTYSESNSAPDKLLFQIDLTPGETRTFYILDASALAAVPPPIVKTYARQITERFNDMAWESDRTAHRMYHQDLIKGEGTISSGIDVWSKRTRDLVVDKWYKNADYHNDHGEGMDDYRVGRSRGGGGLGIWNGTNLYVSINFRSARVITTGPIRSEFELTYDTWDAGGRKVSETKRISIDAGSNMSRAESIFSSDDKSPLQIGVGIAQRPDGGQTNNPGEVPFDGSGGSWTQDKRDGWQTYWQPTDRDQGNIAVGIILPSGIKEFVTETNSFPAPAAADLVTPGPEGLPPIANNLAIASAEVGKPFVYYFGAGWSKSGDFPNPEAWNKYVSRFAERLAAPLQVTIGN